MSDVVIIESCLTNLRRKSEICVVVGQNMLLCTRRKSATRLCFQSDTFRVGRTKTQEVAAVDARLANDESLGTATMLISGLACYEPSLAVGYSLPNTQSCQYQTMLIISFRPGRSQCSLSHQSHIA